MNIIHLKRIFIVLITLFFICGLFINVSNAGEVMLTTLENVDNATDSTNATTTVRSVLGTILVAVQIVAMAVAVVILFVLAMKYMIAAPGEKADIKKSFFVYVVGALIVFGAIGILRLIDLVAQSIG